MSLESFNEECIMLSNKELKRAGQAVYSLLTVATEEKKVTCGLRPAIKVLEKDADDILFCVMPHTKDSATHIQSVLLQAFCYEHNIAIIQVDSVDKLRDVVGAVDCSCILIHKNIKRFLCLEQDIERMLLSMETRFVTQPVFKLPAK